MKKLTVLFGLMSLQIHAQSKILYDLAFSNVKNFEVFDKRDEIPRYFEISNKTHPSNPSLFYLKDIDLDDPKLVENVRNDEHHPYRAYLFANQDLDQKIEASEKKKLYQQAVASRPKTINIKGRNYHSVKHSNPKHPFCFAVSKPIYSSQNNYAFLEIIAYEMLHKQKFYYACVVLMFEKNKLGQWAQIATKAQRLL